MLSWSELEMTSQLGVPLAGEQDKHANSWSTWRDVLKVWRPKKTTGNAKSARSRMNGGLGGQTRWPLVTTYITVSSNGQCALRRDVEATIANKHVTGQQYTLPAIHAIETAPSLGGLGPIRCGGWGSRVRHVSGRSQPLCLNEHAHMRADTFCGKLLQSVVRIVQPKRQTMSLLSRQAWQRVPACTHASKLWNVADPSSNRSFWY
jgi:hypothetical protein